MRNEAVDGMSGEWGTAEGVPRRGPARPGRRRAAGPRPVRPAAAAPAARPVQPVRPASRTAAVAVVAPLFGEPARERTLCRPVAAPAARSGVVERWSDRAPVAVALSREAVRRVLTGLALMVAVAVAVVLLGLIAAIAGEARSGGGAEGDGPGTTVLVSPEGGAATR